MKKKLITTIFSALLALALFCAAQAAVDRTGAQALALKAAGVAEADVRRLSVETETRGGRTVYDVEFRFGGFEYEYWINAEDGAIVKDSWELDPEKTLEMAREQGSGAIDEAARAFRRADGRGRRGGSRRELEGRARRGGRTPAVRGFLLHGRRGI